ncbi:type VI secretion system baseplate subunit TssF [Pseudoduganella namucuonensis]|uniref:Type VI secretion system protein ImpG n=1 Tax=Pseudoduganella namucuonensis TaxID=1035707 RepID=A0A1I7JXH4_9BURK|nr:type VI secretion system baseplate subunit TssF [Pseudoduganella namucuonensis]SFU89858.1 type VI secretion system protein ImpG [Pseudoduganella namucuonensis]
MEDLLPYYERELVTLRRHSREFAERFPKVAARLRMGSDGCADPHVEHLIEAVALLAARVSKRLDDDYPKFTEALLEMLFPHYLRPFPSCAIVQAAEDGERGAAAFTIPRGTELESPPVQGVRCGFRVAYGLAKTPVRLAAARFDAIAAVPAGLGLPAHAGAGLSITLESTPGGPELAHLADRALRVHIDGEASFGAALRDALFISAAGAYIAFDEGGHVPLASVPIAPVGFAEEDALIPFCARSHPAYRLLIEYFAFPEKFNFFDIDLAAMRGGLPAGCRRCTLHLALAGLGPDTQAARMLRSLSADHLRLHCAPVVNLFRRPGEPIALTERTSDHAVRAHATQADAYEVYTVDSVAMLPQGGGADAIDFKPFYSLRHGEEGEGRYWTLRHDDALAAASPGHEKRLSLVNAGAAGLELEGATLSLELTCTNRDLPVQLKYGETCGDLAAPGVAGGAILRFVRRPTQPCRPPMSPGLHWRLISHLTLNQHALTQQGLPAFREMLTLYDLTQGAASQRQVAGVTGLEVRDAVHWMRHQRGASLVHGVEVRLTVDEAAFAGSGLHLFAQVMDRFLGLYAQVNSFSQLVVLSMKSNKELIRCQPRSGHASLV